MTITRTGVMRAYGKYLDYQIWFNELKKDRDNLPNGIQSLNEVRNAMMYYGKEYERKRDLFFDQLLG